MSFGGTTVFRGGCWPLLGLISSRSTSAFILVVVEFGN
jgi:hypothetical protein